MHASKQDKSNSGKNQPVLHAESGGLMSAGKGKSNPVKGVITTCMRTLAILFAIQ